MSEHVLKPSVTYAEIAEKLHLKNARSVTHAISVGKLPPGDLPAGRGRQYSHQLATKILEGSCAVESK